MRGNAIRRPVLVALIGGVVVVVAVLAWFLLRDSSPGSGFFSGEERTNVLFVGLTDRAGVPYAESLVVLSSEPEGDAVFLFVPDELWIKNTDGTFDTVGAAAGRGGCEAVREAVGALLGIEFAHVVGLQDEGLTHLIDGLGGIALNVEQDVVYTDETADPPMDLELRGGEQTLDGFHALAFVRGQSEQSRIQRQQYLLTTLLDARRGECSPREVRRGLTEIEPYLDTNLSKTRLVQLGCFLQASDPEEIRQVEVPGRTMVIDGVPRLVPLVVETERIVSTEIRGLELLTANEVTVAVFNGNGVRMMASQTADYLRARGFQISRIANAEAFTYPTNYIVVLTEEAKAWVLRDALPSAVKIVYPTAFEEHYNALAGLIPAGTDVMLIAGAGMELD